MFEIGDVVKIIGNDEMIPECYDYIGTTATIVDKFLDSYVLDVDERWAWHDDELEKVGEICQPALDGIEVLL